MWLRLLGTAAGPIQTAPRLRSEFVAQGLPLPYRLSCPNIIGIWKELAGLRESDGCLSPPSEADARGGTHSTTGDRSAACGSISSRHDERNVKMRSLHLMGHLLGPFTSCVSSLHNRRLGCPSPIASVDATPRIQRARIRSGLGPRTCRIARSAPCRQGPCQG